MIYRRNGLFIVSAIVISLSSLAAAPSQAASPKPGSRCSTPNQINTAAGLRYVCTKVKGKLMWSKGVKVSVTPKPSPTPSINDQNGQNSGPQDGGQNSPWLGLNWDVTSIASLEPKCSSAMPLTSLMTELNSIESISPLGFVQADAHNTTVPHLYINTGSANGSSDANGLAYRSKKVPVYAPADMTISGIITTTPMSSPFTEYSVGAHVCGRLWIAFNHVDDLEPALKTAFDKLKNVQNPQYNISLKAGTKIAMSSGRSAGFDFRAMDTTGPTLTRLNPKAWSPGWTTAVCGLDWYSPAIKDFLYGKLATKRTTNKCGEPAMDIPGTASGAWLPIDHADSGNYAGESQTFSLVQTNDDPERYYFSIGISAVVDGIKSQTYRYKVSTAGLNNPKAENVKSGDVACIDNLIPQGPYSGEAYPRVYIQMVTAPVGQLETISVASASAGSCGAAPYTMPSGVKKFARYNIPASQFIK